MTTSPALAAFEESVRALGAALPSADVLAGLDDHDLLEALRITSVALRKAQSTFAAIAAETSARSAPALGAAGLAQASGHRTPELLLRAATGSTAREAATAVRVGAVMRSALPGQSSSQPWLAEVGRAVSAGSLSVAAAESIQSGLGSPSGSVTVSLLASAVDRLLQLNLDPDRLFRRARDERDEMDAQAVVGREYRQRAARALRFTTRPDGMGRVTWDLDPESAARFRDLYDRATSPRRGGPRFVSATDAAAATAVERDERTTEQLASDVFLHLLAHGADADSNELLGSGAPVLRIVVAATALASREGFGVIEGTSQALSIASIERATCTATTVAVHVDAEGEVLDIGREQRLHTRRQRSALATRDGGCRWPGCDRPPSWCEAHHIRHWQRDGGRTSVENGILLCRHHHLLAHNNGWEIARRPGGFVLVPPASVDPDQRGVPMPTKSRVVEQVIAGQRGAVSRRALAEHRDAVIGRDLVGHGEAVARRVVAGQREAVVVGRG